MSVQIIGSGPGYMTLADTNGQQSDYQKGSFRPIVRGINVGLAEVGAEYIVEIVHPIPFDEWLDPLAVPYPDITTLLTDIQANGFQAGDIPDAPVDGDPYVRQDGVWVNDRLSKITVGVQGGQDVNTGAGALMIFDTIDEQWPAANPDFTFAPIGTDVTCNRDGVIEVSYSVISQDANNIRLNPAMAVLLVPGGGLLRTFSAGYGRNLTDNTVQNEVSGKTFPVTSGTIVQLFAIQFGSAGVCSTVAGFSTLEIKYVNNARA